MTVKPLLMVLGGSAQDRSPLLGQMAVPPAVKLKLEVGDILLDLDEEGSRQNLGALLEPCRSSSLTDTTQAKGSSVSLTLGSSHTTVYPTSMRAPTTPASGLMSPARRRFSILYSNLTSPAWCNTI